MIKNHYKEQFKEFGFWGERRYLSNMYEVPIYYNGNIYNSSEALYMSFKSPLISWQEFVLYNEPKLIKEKSYEIELVDNWEEIKVEKMKLALICKFSQHPTLLKKLKEEKELIEYNYWGDEFWGVCLKTAKGKNMLGILLDEIRKIL